MKKTIHIICLLYLFLGCSIVVSAQGLTCQTATPMCDDITPYPINYTGTGLGQGPQAPAGNNYACLGTTGNPTFFTITITQSGTIQFDLQNTNVIDVDFILWGPYSDLLAANAACGNLGNGGAGGTVVDCSYDPQAFETVNISNAIAGEVYILMVTNYANTATDVFSTPNVGTGALGCPCQLDVDYTLPPLANNNGLLTAVNGDSAEFTVCPGDTLYFNMAIGADNLADTLSIFSTLTTIDAAFTPSQYEIFGPFYPNAPLQDSMEILIMITPGPNDVGVYNFIMGVENAGTSACFDSYPITVVVPGIPDLPPGDTICAGGSYQLTAGSFPATASGSDTYLWTQISGPVASFDDNTLQNPTITPPIIPSGDSMLFELQYTYGSCTQFDTIKVYGYDIAINMTAAPNPVCAGQPVNLTALLTDSIGAVTTTTCLPTYTATFPTFATVAGSGTTVNLGDDQLSGALPIGFTFSFYCNNYTQFYISSNGFITFNAGSGDGCCSGQFLPDALIPNDLIAFNWTDLDPSSGGTIEYFTTGVAPNRRLVMNFNNVPTYWGNDLIIAQVVLHETTNLIETNVTYGSSNFDSFFGDDPVTVGIENATGTVATPTALNQASAVFFTNQSILYTPNITTTTTSAPISYNWSPTVSDPSIYNPVGTPNSPTNYMVTITNGACQFTDSIQVNITGSLAAPTVSCGTSTYTTIGFNWTDVGLPAGGFYEYSTDGGVTWTSVGTALSATLTGLAPGTTINILVRGNDGLGTACSGGIPGSVTCTTNPCALVLLDTITDVLCNGDLTGAININVTNGSPSYSFDWSNGSTNEDLTGLSGGTYYLTITDAVGCTLLDTFDVFEPAKGLGLSLTSVSTLCNGSNDGCAQVTVAFASGTLSYNWSSVGLSSDSICGLSAGTYVVTVTDTIGSGSNLVQNDLYSESFDGTHGWTLNVPTGTNGVDNNFWEVDADEAGQAPGACGAAGGPNRTLHITSVFNPAGGAAYDAGGLCGFLFCPETNQRAESPVFSTVGYTNLTLSFNFMSYGDGLTDNASVWYSDNGGSSWQVLNPSIKSLCCGGVPCSGFLQGEWTQFSQTLPASCENNPAVRVAINWTNNDDGVGTDPSVAIDSVLVFSLGGSNAAGVCVSIDSVVVNEPTAVSVNLDSLFNVNCFGDSTAAIYLSANGGVGNYSYNWSNGDSGAALTGLAANTYSVTATDSNSCATIETYTITEPSIVASTVDSTLSPTCNGSADGAIYISASGGNPSYSFLWSNGSTTEDLNGIASGSYFLTITDANGCESYLDTSIFQPGAVSVSLDTFQQISCNGANDGSISVLGASGTPSYNYIWSNAATTSSISGLAANTYVVTISDQNACTDTLSFVISEPSALNVTDSVVHVDCNGNATGQGLLSVSGGSGGYSFLWPGSETSQNVSGLTAGNYTITVTDANSCSITYTININEPASAVTLNTSAVNDVLCNGNATGDATVVAFGGTGAFSYLWDASAAAQTSANATGLSAGNYAVTATDSLGCTDVLIITITEPSALSVAATVTDESCGGINNGSIAITATGGASGYTYLWDAAAGAQTDATATGLAANTYAVTVTDANNCTATSGGTVNPSVPLDSATVPLASYVDSLDCDTLSTGLLTVLPSSGTGYTYLWSNGATDASAAGLFAGNYVVTITNSSGCTVTQSAVVIAPFVPSINPVFLPLSTDTTTIEPDATVSIDGGNDQSALGVTYLWSTGSTAVSFGLDTDHSTEVTASDVGTYVLLLTATASSGCVDTGSIYLTVSSPFVGIPDAFSPNGDGVNETFGPVGLTADQVRTFKIFNRWSQEIYDGSDNPNLSWDGTYRGVLQPQEVYIYLVEYQWAGETKILRGEFTLMR